ncbi:glycosyl hydrolase [Plebeiibacterium sediminum]|uniref:Glycosyl hydrolase n=1 Tax=Plebeiibacterium sediminum TaxID=2992112 RepID=A0AAE3M2I7_9BACT|nr:glycosyl hydrolase [Plebeiobacterium sediminum]MCW3785939.1 glycosyl hydrolase [Plebeiobacterium sediminum]
MKKIFCILLIGAFFLGCNSGSSKEEKNYPTTESAKPWTLWYWMHGEVSKEGITADLEAMKEIGLGGAYLSFIKDLRDSSLIENPVKTLTPEWWEMIKHVMKECDRLDLKLGMHSCDGFSCAGGPWITPDKSMQKVVWSDTIVKGGHPFQSVLSVPKHKENYYEDIAIYAYPVKEGAGVSSFQKQVKVTTDATNNDINYLAKEGNNKQFKSKEPCYIQYEFEEPFTCRSLIIHSGWYNYHSNRFLIQVSNDGVHFKDHYQMTAPRQGWQDVYANATSLIPEVTAKYFRFVYDPTGMDAGAEDLDAAKWKPSLRVKGIELSSDVKIHQYEGKSGVIWRIAQRTKDNDLKSDECVALDHLVDITSYMSKDGTLTWDIPEGNWRILRMGHTTTGTTNYIGGGGKGLECDKLDSETVAFQFDQWFGEVFRQVGPELANTVLKRFFIDSWECGSQNWSPVLRDEFIKRRGYDYYKYLPVLAGIPIENADKSEEVLTDLRETIAELVADNLFGTMQKLAHEKDCHFAAESVSPIMVSDGMLHFKNVDSPMGEFWFRSPSHDKPNDMMDAISGAHIYGKQIIQAESLTEIRLDWDEHPGILKPVIDRNFALGINKIFFHVFTQNPWIDRRPGMTLDVIGTYFQRDQTWWKQSSAFIDYLTNCQALLQTGKPVTDIAVFTGEEIPRRSILPDRLVPILHGIMGEERLANEKKRLSENNYEVRHIPQGVTTLESIADPEEWINPLMGYAYDSFNKDALIHLASVKDGKIVLPGGAEYKLLVVPGQRKMAPNGGEKMSVEVASKLLELTKQGATILMMEKPSTTYGASQEDDQKLKSIINELFTGSPVQMKDEKGNSYNISKVGNGRVIVGPFVAGSFDQIDLIKDFKALNITGKEITSMAWNHRSSENEEIYFVANQLDNPQEVTLSFRENEKTPVIYDPVTNTKFLPKDYAVVNGRTDIKYKMESNQSIFVIFEKEVTSTISQVSYNKVFDIEGTWSVQFDKDLGGPSEAIAFNELTSWSESNNDSIRYYSGTASYKNSFNWDESNKEKQVWLKLSDFDNIAEVKVNNVPCGICWTKPYRVDISNAIKSGTNNLEIEITNTWANRLMGDHQLPEDERVTYTTAPYRLDGRELLPAGLYGPVTIEVSE